MLGKENVDDIEKIIVEGHSTAFTSLYTQYFKKLLIESDKYVKDIYLAEEIVQDVFLKMWEKSEDFTQIRSIKAYLYKSVINSSINYFNRQKSLEQHHQKIVNTFEEENVDDLDEENELIIKLYREIEKLPTKCREIFKMNRFERLKYREIALKFDISERTVENHIANALKILRESMLQGNKGGSYSSKLKILRLLSFF